MIFFLSLANSLGRFICVDDRTTSGSWFDVARLLVEVPLEFNIHGLYPVEINGISFQLVIREDCKGACSSSGITKSISSCSVSTDSDSVSSEALGISENDIEEFSNSKDSVGSVVGDSVVGFLCNTIRGTIDFVRYMPSNPSLAHGLQLGPSSVLAGLQGLAAEEKEAVVECADKAVVGAKIAAECVDRMESVSISFVPDTLQVCCSAGKAENGGVRSPPVWT